MTSQSKKSPIIRSQENNLALDTKTIIEIQVAARRYKNYLKRIIKNTIIRVHYTMETSSKLTVTSINCQRAGIFQYLY